MKKIIRDIKTRTEILLAPFNWFFKNESGSGIILLIFAIIAMILANTAVADSYNKLLHTYLAIGTFKLSILHWINDGLMAIFFFVVGLEIKREFLFGELKSLSATILPVTAAIGGMLVPAVIYMVINWGEPTIKGWGIPMATDIAFSLGILSIAASQAPRSIAVFLTALAIVDDLGAIIVIALFYSNDVSLIYLIYGLLALLAAIVLNHYGNKNVILYIIMGIIAWRAFYEAGIHPTIAGVILGMTIPADNSQCSDKSLLHKIEHVLAPYSSWFIMPIFALANAGVPIEFSGLTQVFTPVSIGIVLGLVLGKPLGIFGTAWFLFKMKILKIPEYTSYKQFWGAGTLGGIGFTMSLFIASLAFTAIPEYLVAAKIGIILASCLSGLIGIIIFKTIKYEQC